MEDRQILNREAFHGAARQGTNWTGSRVCDSRGVRPGRDFTQSRTIPMSPCLRCAASKTPLVDPRHKAVLGHWTVSVGDRMTDGCNTKVLLKVPMSSSLHSQA